MGLIALLAASDKMFAPVLDPLDRIAEADRQPRNQKIFRIKPALRTEAAADPRRNHSDLVLRHIHELQQRAANSVRSLAGSPDGQESRFGLVLSDDAAGFDGVAAAAMHSQ